MKTAELIKLKQIVKDLEAEIENDKREVNKKQRRLNALKGIADTYEEQMNKRVNEKLKK